MTPNLPSTQRDGDVAATRAIWKRSSSANNVLRVAVAAASRGGEGGTVRDFHQCSCISRCASLPAMNAVLCESLLPRPSRRRCCPGNRLTTRFAEFRFLRPSHHVLCPKNAVCGCLRQGSPNYGPRAQSGRKGILLVMKKQYLFLFIWYNVTDPETITLCK